MSNKEITLGEIRKDYKENKEEWDKILAEGTKRKYEACTIRDKQGKATGFDYFKMSQMYHSGEW